MGAQFGLVRLLPLLMLGSCTPSSDSPPSDRAVDDTPGAGVPEVLTGIDALAAADFAPLRGRRVGLITNHTGIDRTGASTIDRLQEAPEVQLVALFSPEHGVRGRAQPGETVSDATDPRTGLPIHSLYGRTREPTRAMLSGIDVLVIDIQDVGARYYTYAWTMVLAMRAAAEHGISFMVLDRPNPLGGRVVQGNVLDSAYASLVGLYPVAMRHGLTLAELARMVNEELSLGLDLHLERMSGWRREMRFDATGLPWVAPSPNMPSIASALHYPGTCLFEGTNLSVGRGTEHPFQQIGAAWLNNVALIGWLQLQGLKGVRFDTVSFTPRGPADGKFAGERVRGVRFIATDADAYDPTVVAVAVLAGIHALHAAELEWIATHFDRLAGTDRLRLAVQSGAGWQEIVAGWGPELERFRALRDRYLLY